MRKKSLFGAEATLGAAALLSLSACSDSSSGADSFTYTDENGDEVNLDVKTGTFKDSRDGYGVYQKFDRSTSTYSNEISMSASMYVRCLSDENTIYGSLGKCDSAQEGKVGSSDSVYYTCRNDSWVESTREDRSIRLSCA